MKNKLKTRNNIITKLAGTSWGCNAYVLRTSTLALVYSVAEYCAPVWMISAHSNKVDVQLNQAMRIITGTVKSTQTQWLPALSDLLPPELCRKNVASSILEQIKNNKDLPVHNDVFLHPDKRLKSRHPIWSVKNPHRNYGKNNGKNLAVKNSSLIDDPNIKPPGFELSRPIWTTLNRIRSDQGNCN